MLRLTIFNMDEFLKAVNNCTGPVYLLNKEGASTNLRTSESARAELRRRYRSEGDLLKLSLEVPMPRDYLHMVFSTI